MLASHGLAFGVAATERRKHWVEIQRSNRGGSEPDLCVLGEPEGRV